MGALVDASLWVDFTRARSPLGLKQFIAPHILAPDVCLAEPVAFEVLRGASDAEIPLLHEQFATLPMLPVPEDFWRRAAELGRACRRSAPASAPDPSICSSPPWPSGTMQISSPSMPISKPSQPSRR